MSIYILGAGGFAKELARLLERMREKQSQPYHMRGYNNVLNWESIVLISDDLEQHGKMMGSWMVISPTMPRPVGSYTMIGVGSPALRKKFAERFKDESFITATDP